MGEIFGGVWRITLSALAGGALGVLAAVNWPNPDSVAAGVLLGVGGVTVGGLCGFWWALRWGEKRW